MNKKKILFIMMCCAYAISLILGVISFIVKDEYSLLLSIPAIIIAIAAYSFYYFGSKRLN